MLFSLYIWYPDNFIDLVSSIGLQDRYQPGIPCPVNRCGKKDNPAEIVHNK